MGEQRTIWMASRPARALRILRVLWVTLLFWQIAFLALIIIRASMATPIASNRDAVIVMFWVSVALLAVAVPGGYLLRSQIYKRYWHKDGILPGGYVAANILLLGLLAGVSLFGLFTMLLNNRLLFTVIPSVVAMAVQITNFPTGAPMQPHIPEFCERSQP